MQTFIDRARAVIAEELRDGPPSIEHISKKLGTSTRTLQRRLHEERTSHKMLVGEVRRELATRMLHTGTSKVMNVAFMLGYSDPAAFYRAFRRWTGMTTTDYRAKHS